jgi:antirestriction protein
VSTNKRDSQIRIYAACLAAYNNGTLHGAWINANQEPEDIRAEIDKMLSESPELGAEEWGIFDYEGFCGVSISEYESLNTVSALARFVDEYGKLGAELYAYAGDIDEAKQIMEEQYLGEWDSIRDWATDLLEQSGQLESIPEHLRYYFDYESYARDCELSGEIFTIEIGRKVHVFSAR